MAEPRRYVDASLAEGAEIALDPDAGRHIGAVLRLGAGDVVRVFNGHDGEWRARILSVDKKGVRARVEDFVRAPSPVRDLDLLFAPVKRQATDLIVEKSAELGVRRLRPVKTQRTIAENVRVERLAAIARSAAEQTERFEAPTISAPAPLARVLSDWESGRRLIYADEQGDCDSAPWGGDVGRAQPLLNALRALAPAPDRLAVLIGPEGGFTPDERAVLRRLDFVIPVSLGPRILRAETAVIAALSVVQAQWGDWG